MDTGAQIAVWDITLHPIVKTRRNVPVNSATMLGIRDSAMLDEITALQTGDVLQ
jgi:hypothetical protein